MNKEPTPTKVLVNNEAVPVQDTKTVINFKAPQPAWAKSLFLIVLLLSTVTIGYIAATDLMPEKTKYEVTLFLTLLVNPVVWGLSKIFGIELKSDK